MATSGCGRHVAMLHSRARRGPTPCPTCKEERGDKSAQCRSSQCRVEPAQVEPVQVNADRGLVTPAAGSRRPQHLRSTGCPAAAAAHPTQPPIPAGVPPHQHCGLGKSLRHIVHADGQRGDQALRRKRVGGGGWAKVAPRAGLTCGTSCSLPLPRHAKAHLVASIAIGTQPSTSQAQAEAEAQVHIRAHMPTCAQPRSPQKETPTAQPSPSA